MKTPDQRQTIASFEYKWKHFRSGAAHLSNPEFVKQLPDMISSFTALPKDWFAGKKCLDAGCGNGRITYGLSEMLGASTDAFDITTSGVTVTRQVCPHANVFQADILDLPQLSPYDLVWSFGVVHHTGNPELAFKSIASLVKPEGYLFVMVYGNYAAPLKKWNNFFQRFHIPFWFQERLLRLKYPKDNLIAAFDATSPRLNQYFSYETVHRWFEENGFNDIKRAPSNPHHVVVGKKVVLQ